MKEITISQTIKKAIPTIKLGCISAEVKYEKHNGALWQLIEKETERISKLTTSEIKNIPQIHSTREAYKALGKEPSRYRPSAEALMRRLIQGKGMYQISNLVDTINLSSIKTGYSIGGYDYEKINGKIILDKGNSEFEYQAIGRGIMNIENLPVFFDETGPFGSPTSDSQRTMITESSNKILLIFLNFGNHENFEADLDNTVQLIKNYCYGKNIETKIIS